MCASRNFLPICDEKENILLTTLEICDKIRHTLFIKKREKQFEEEH